MQERCSFKHIWGLLVEKGAAALLDNEVAAHSNTRIYEPLLTVPPGESFVIAQLGQSLDGRIATRSGASRYINGGEALDHLHRLRALVDGVVVGAGTIAADDPQLNVRRCAGRPPARIVIDPSGRTPRDAKWLADDGARRIVFTRNAEGWGKGPLVLPLPDGDAPAAIVDALRAQGLHKLLIEGGAATISRFIDAAAVDRLHILLAPMIIGSGRNGLDLAPIDRLDQALRPQTAFYPLPDGDVLFDCNLRMTQREGSADE